MTTRWKWTISLVSSGFPSGRIPGKRQQFEENKKTKKIDSTPWILLYWLCCDTSLLSLFVDSFSEKGVKSDSIGLTFVNPGSTGLASKTVVRFKLPENRCFAGTDLNDLYNNRERFVVLYLCCIFLESFKKYLKLESFDFCESYELIIAAMGIFCFLQIPS